ncbi:hypothetical protein GF342_00885 [Candidatus Woesearchaeota archaeon]|nr:hypothetical protein [Candidatus Woesearchaeota archaeon]
MRWHVQLASFVLVYGILEVIFSLVWPSLTYTRVLIETLLGALIFAIPYVRTITSIKIWRGAVGVGCTALLSVFFLIDNVVHQGSLGSLLVQFVSAVALYFLIVWSST